MTIRTASPARWAPARRRTVFTALGAVLAGLVPLIGLWLRRIETRRALAKLDTEHLEDVGLTAAGARRECRKPFWRA